MTEKELLNQGYRKYSGKAIDVYFNLDICQHSGNCMCWGWIKCYWCIS